MFKRLLIFILLSVLLTPTTILAEQTFPFEGQIDLVKKEFLLTVALADEGSVTVRISPARKADFHYSVNIDHLTAPLMNLSTVIEGDVKLETLPSGERSVTGRIESKYTLINYKPIEEMSGVFNVKDGLLNIDALSLGRVNIKGSIGLQRPFALNIVADLNDVMMEDFLWFWSGGQFTPENTPSEGLVSGAIFVTGDMQRLRLQGELSSYGGRVSDLAYDTIFVNAEGDYPVINLYNSTVTETNGFTFTIDGSLNLEDRENFPKQIMALSKAPLVSQDPSKLEWTFKRIQKEKSSGTTEIKYMRRKDTLESSRDDESEMLGIERRIGF